MTRLRALLGSLQAPVRAHVAYAALRAVRVPEHVALDLVWGWFGK